MMWSTLFFAALTVAAPTNTLVLHEKRTVSSGAVGRGLRVDPDAVLPVRIALKQNNLDDGYEHLMGVSDPDSPNYGKHWTIDEIHETFAPSLETVEAVKSWLDDSGFSLDYMRGSTSRGWLEIHMPVSAAEKLFGTEYYEHHDHEGNTRIGCDQYHVPSHLSQHIDFVKPGVSFSRPVKRTTVRQELSRLHARSENQTIPDISATSLATCGEYITPACLKALYNIPDAQYNQPENVLGVFEDGDVYDQEDLDLYFKNYAPWVPQGTHPTLASINNATAPVGVKSPLVGGESDVDFDLAYALLYPQEIKLFQTNATTKQLAQWAKEGSGNKIDKLLYAQDLGLIVPFLDAVDGAFCTEDDRKNGAECGTVELTTVLSASYSVPELFMPEAELKRACAEYMKLGLKGHTLLFATGDYGPAGHAIPGVTFNACVLPGHTDNPIVNGTVFNPQFPATCPYITAVGGTQLPTNGTINDAEETMNIPAFTKDPALYSFSSSGGTSNYFKQPWYQCEAVDSYFANHNPGYPTYVYNGKATVGANGGKYALGGRAIPDVAANGAHLAIFQSGKFVPGGQGGTSLATPIFASLITMINQERTLAGKGPVGFINPVLYKHPEVFHDIVAGNAPGCGTAGFAAVEGWDPTTGLGTPNYPALLQVFMDLP